MRSVGIVLSAIFLSVTISGTALAAAAGTDSEKDQKREEMRVQRQEARQERDREAAGSKGSKSSGLTIRAPKAASSKDRDSSWLNTTGKANDSWLNEKRRSN